MSAIPDLLRIGSIPSNLNMSVETGILDPVVQNDNFIRFNMKRAGFLHSNSKLVLSLSKNSATAAAATTALAAGQHTFFPPNVGVGSLIERVRLLSGNTVIQEIQDWSHLQAFKSTLISNENNKEREQYTTGRVINLELDYKKPGDEDEADGISIGNGLEYSNAAVATYDTTLTNWSRDLPRQFYLEHEPTYQISLSDLCPFLKQTQLPLFMFEEEIFLEITYTDQDRRTVMNPEQTADDATVRYSVNQAESKLIIDYITYPNETMEAWANANKNLQFQYTDYELSKFTVSKSAANSGIIRNIGGAGRVVNKCLMALSRDALGQEKLCGNNEAIHPVYHATTSQERVITNLRYNDEYLYPIDVKNDAYHFNNCLQSEGQPLMITRDMYCGQGNATGLRKFEGIAIANAANGIKNDFFYQSLKLNKNPRINQKGIELYQTIIDTEDVASTMRVWIEVMKVATLVDGKLRSTYL
tara:strand:+ start:2953 stop:4368 length:1416 start_codon:yes stop_codon:yes gene_type:complete